MSDLSKTEALIERLRLDAEWADGQEWEAPICLADDLREAVEAIQALEAKVRAMAKLPTVIRCQQQGDNNMVIGRVEKLTIT